MAESNEAAAYASRGAAHITREARRRLSRLRWCNALSIARRKYEDATEVRKLIVVRELLEARELTWRQEIE